MNCPECNGPLRATTVGAAGAAGEFAKMPTGSSAWSCDGCGSRWVENPDDGELQKLPDS